MISNDSMKERLYEHFMVDRTVMSCAVRSKDIVVFHAIPNNYEEYAEEYGMDEETDNMEVMFALYLDETSSELEDCCWEFRHNQMRLELCAGGKEPPFNVIGTTFDTHVYNYEENVWEEIPPEKIVAMKRPRYIGEHFYASGTGRAVFKRFGPDDWRYISESAYAPDLEGGGNRTRGGFYDIDGFAEDDIYAAGGEGQVWHYNGKLWRRVELPTNAELECVCCAEDGYVYLGGVGHLIIRGRGDNWEIINQERVNDTFFQFVNYQGKVLGIDEYGATIYEILSDGFRELDTGGYEFLYGSCLCLAAGDGILVAAGVEAASVFDGERWVSLFEPPGMRELSNQVETMQAAYDKIEAELEKIREIDDATR